MHCPDKSLTDVDLQVTQFHNRGGYRPSPLAPITVNCDSNFHKMTISHPIAYYIYLGPENIYSSETSVSNDALNIINQEIICFFLYRHYKFCNSTF